MFKDSSDSENSRVLKLAHSNSNMSNNKEVKIGNDYKVIPNNPSISEERLEQFINELFAYKDFKKKAHGYMVENFGALYVMDDYNPFKEFEPNPDISHEMSNHEFGQYGFCGLCNSELTPRYAFNNAILCCNECETKWTYSDNPPKFYNDEGQSITDTETVKTLDIIDYGPNGPFSCVEPITGLETEVPADLREKVRNSLYEKAQECERIKAKYMLDVSEH